MWLAITLGALAAWFEWRYRQARRQEKKPTGAAKPPDSKGTKAPRIEGAHTINVDYEGVK
jgi:hypothetical protein